MFKNIRCFVLYLLIVNMRSVVAEYTDQLHSPDSLHLVHMQECFDDELQLLSELNRGDYEQHYAVNILLALVVHWIWMHSLLYNKTLWSHQH